MILLVVLLATTHVIAVALTPAQIVVQEPAPSLLALIQVANRATSIAIRRTISPRPHAASSAPGVENSR